jgi:hypothetical protein
LNTRLGLRNGIVAVKNRISNHKKEKNRQSLDFGYEGGKNISAET